MSLSGGPSNSGPLFRPMDRPDREDRSYFQRRRDDQRRRHADPGWFEWTLREFARFWYLIGALAVVVLVPLQIEEALIPTASSPVVSPVLVGLAMLAAAAVLFVAAVLGYLYLWKADGIVDHLVADHGK